MKVIYQNLGTKCRAYIRCCPDGYVTIVINNQLSWLEQRKAYAHELKHINENDLFSHMSASEIEKIRHSFPSKLAFYNEQTHQPKQLHEETRVIGFYRKSQEEIEFEQQQEIGKFFEFVKNRQREEAFKNENTR